MRNFLTKYIFKDQFQQFFFTFKQVFLILWKINPKLTLLIFALSAFWGLLTAPAFYLEKLILDRLVENIGNTDLKSVIYPLSFLVIARLIVETLRNILNRVLYFLRQYASKNFHIQIELILADKLSRLDVMTVEDPKFQDRYNKIERESGRRAWGLVMPLTDIPNYVFGFLSSVGILWFLHPLIALGVILVSVPSVIVDRKYIRYWYDFERDIAPLHRIRGHIAHYLIRSRNYLEMRILKLRDYLITKMGDVHGEILKKEMELSRQQETSSLLTSLPSLLFYGFVNIYLVIWTLTSKITIGSYNR